MGGHIGYGIRPSMRGRKLAPIMLALALKKAKAFGIKKALVTCDEWNQASAATIEACGGVLENIVLFEGERIKRYWIDND
jgi:predicted acetyltransferase